MEKIIWKSSSFTFVCMLNLSVMHYQIGVGGPEYNSTVVGAFPHEVQRSEFKEVFVLCSIKTNFFAIHNI